MLLLAPIVAIAIAAGSPECQPAQGLHSYQPQYHIIGGFHDPGRNGTTWPGGVNDANAVFGRRGVYHVMHQCDGGPDGTPCGGGWEGPGHNKSFSPWYHSWGHVVSKDLVHWTRLQDPLSPSATVPGYEYGEDCDGSLSFVDGEPIITFGPGCDPPRFSDAPVVALARPKVMMIIPF